ncbi:Protein ROD1 [Metarhizium anisopliae]
MVRCDIRLIRDHISFRGHPHESAGQVLIGSVLLRVSTPVNKVHFRLRLLGKLEAADASVRKWQKVLNFNATKTTVSKTIISEQSQAIIGLPTSDGVTLPTGRHEYPFELLLPGDVTESIEELPELSLKYRLEATIYSRGVPVEKAHKHVRIFRVAATDAVEPFHAEISQGTWRNKVDYCFNIPQRVVPFGGVVDLSILVSALVVGLDLEGIRLKVVEDRQSCVKNGAGRTTTNHFTRVLAKTWVNDGRCQQLSAKKKTDLGMGCWCLSARLPLPSSLKECAQDIDLGMIKVAHFVEVVAVLKNPDGHVSNNLPIRQVNTAWLISSAWLVLLSFAQNYP